MKKLLVVMLVLAVAGTANAALSLISTGVPVGNTDALKLNASTEEGRGGYYIVILTSGTTSTDAAFNLDNAIVTYAGVPSQVVFEYDSDSGLSGSDLLNVGLWNEYLNATFSDTVEPMDAVIGDLITGIGITGTGTVNIGYFSGQDLSPMGTQSIVLPEPITIGLLGLGALFLRRRK
jgi:hypothetical protein